MSFYKNKLTTINTYEITATSSNINTPIEHFNATENQKVFTLVNSYEIGKNRLQVVVGGVKQYTPNNYTETTSNSITFIEGLSVGTEVTVEITKIV